LIVIIKAEKTSQYDRYRLLKSKVKWAQCWKTLMLRRLESGSPVWTIFDRGSSAAQHERLIHRLAEACRR
jgi:hypothetical protein